MKEYKIRTFSLNELEEKLNRFFEHHRESELMTITSFGSIAELDFVKGKTKSPVIVSVYYIEPQMVSIANQNNQENIVW